MEDRMTDLLAAGYGTITQRFDELDSRLGKLEARMDKIVVRMQEVESLIAEATASAPQDDIESVDILEAGLQGSALRLDSAAADA